MRGYRAVLSFCLMLLICACANAHAPSDWLRVRLGSGQSVQGEAFSFSADSLSVLLKSGAELNVAYTDVARLERKVRSRLVAAERGLLMGAAVGFALGSAAGPYCRQFHSCPSPTLEHRIKMGLVVGGICAFSATGISALIGVPTWNDVTLGASGLEITL